MDERAGDGEPLGQPARQRARRTLGPRVEPVLLEQRVGPGGGLAHVVDVAREDQVLPRGELGLQERGVSHQPDLPALPAAITPGRAHAQAAPAGTHQTGQQP